MTLLIGQACWDARLNQAMEITALVKILPLMPPCPTVQTEQKSGIRTSCVVFPSFQSLSEY